MTAACEQNIADKLCGTDRFCPEKKKCLFGRTIRQKATEKAKAGRDCRDAFLGLMKTCGKLEIRFWDYLGYRLDAPGAPNVAPLPQLIRQAASA